MGYSQVLRMNVNPVAKNLVWELLRRAFWGLGRLLPTQPYNTGDTLNCAPENSRREAKREAYRAALLYSSHHQESMTGKTHGCEKRKRGGRLMCARCALSC
jgi:hypothetical protein